MFLFKIFWHSTVDDDFYEAEVTIVPSGFDENNAQITDTYTTFEQITIQVRDDYTWAASFDLYP